MRSICLYAGFSVCVVFSFFSHVEVVCDSSLSLACSVAWQLSLFMLWSSSLLMKVAQHSPHFPTCLFFFFLSSRIITSLFLPPSFNSSLCYHFAPSLNHSLLDKYAVLFGQHQVQAYVNIK